MGIAGAAPGCGEKLPWFLAITATSTDDHPGDALNTSQSDMIEAVAVVVSSSGGWMQRLIERIAMTIVFTLCACMGVGCGSNGPNVIEGTTSGGSVHLEIDDGSSSGVESAHVPASLITVVGKDPTSGAAGMFLGGYADEGNGFSKKEWQVLFTVTSAPAPGAVYTIVSKASNPLVPGEATLSFEEDDRLAGWVGQSGSVTVDSLVATTASFAVSMAIMAPSEDAATGTFSFNGNIRIDLSNLCNCSD